jgi:hypothetical protein
MSAADEFLVYDLIRRLDALRRYDQHFSRADWRPQRHPGDRSSTNGSPRANK